MGSKSKIEWTDATYNVVTGCTKVGIGCKNCYAERQFPRIYSKDRVDVPGGSRPRVFTDVRCHHDRLVQPRHWRKPRLVFTCSMGDLFHPDVPTSFIRAVFSVIATERQHTFQLLTKRMTRAHDIICQWEEDGLTLRDGHGAVLPNVWLGTSIARGDEMVNARALEHTPAVVKFLSIEPLVGKVDRIPRWLDWVIVGAESGPKRRPCDRAWAEWIVKECERQGIPVFVKQLHDQDGNIAKMPKVLGRVWNQMPRHDQPKVTEEGK